jgi:uncharacterized membrane protein YidH (DUF202 family)
MDKFLTISNLAIFIIVIAILLHILGYVEIRVKNREGMTKHNSSILVGVLLIVWSLVVTYVFHIIKKRRES